MLPVRQRAEHASFTGGGAKGKALRTSEASPILLLGCSLPPPHNPALCREGKEGIVGPQISSRQLQPSGL